MKMKNEYSLIFMILSALLLRVPQILAQCQPYLGQTSPGNTPVRLVPDNLAANSSWQYHGTPSFSPDGTEMYYAIYRFNPGRTEIWHTECMDGIWKTPQKAPFSIDNYENNNPIFSRDKDTLYFFSPRPGGLYFKVTRTNGVWSSPIPLNVMLPPGYQTGLQFSIANNGNLYIELSKPGSEEDIYILRYANGRYQSPEKITEICSKELDYTPYIDPDERFIMFASRRPGGFGTTDIYISPKNLNGTWSSPINLGRLINSGDVIQPWMSRDGKYFFFEAWMPGAAGGNPYWVDANVIFDLITDIKNEQSKPTDFYLLQNYPNPFNPATKIKYQIKDQVHVNLTVFDILGSKVSELVNKIQGAGIYEIGFDASELNSGIYIYKLTAGKFSLSRKMIIAK